MSPDLKSEPLIACPSCGADNRLGVPFCSRCGARMYGKNVEPPKVKKKTVGGAKRALINAGVALVVVWMVGTVALALWPFESPGGGVLGSSGPVETYVASVQSALEADRPVPNAVLLESDLNAFLMRNRMGETGKADRGVLRARISTGRVLLIANEKTGPFHISTRLVLVDGEENAPLRVDSLWVGHLPLPAFLAEPWTVSLARRFDLGLERRMWEEVRLLRADRSRVILGEASPASGD